MDRANEEYEALAEKYPEWTDLADATATEEKLDAQTNKYHQKLAERRQGKIQRLRNPDPHQDQGRPPKGPKPSGKPSGKPVSRNNARRNQRGPSTRGPTRAGKTSQQPTRSERQRRPPARRPSPQRRRQSPPGNRQRRHGSASLPRGHPPTQGHRPRGLSPARDGDRRPSTRRDVQPQHEDQWRGQYPTQPQHEDQWWGQYPTQPQCPFPIGGGLRGRTTPSPHGL